MKCRFPIDCVLALTYRCNSRCTMCDIWKMENSPELPVLEFAKLPSSLRDINLSGGEPFLRQDLAEIVAVVAKACPQARFVISSNGFATELILEQMKKVLKIKPDIGIAISVDGIGEMHNEIRGIPGGFDRTIATVKGLKALGMTNLRLAFTTNEKNINHLSKVYNLAQELGVQFTNCFAQSSEFYFGGKQNINHPRREFLVKEYNYLIKQELKSWNLKRWARAYFAYGMYKFIINKQEVLSNAPGRDFFLWILAVKFIRPWCTTTLWAILKILAKTNFRPLNNFGVRMKWKRGAWPWMPARFRCGKFAPPGPPLKNIRLKWLGGFLKINLVE